MPKLKNNFSCPECNSTIKAWADLDAQVTFEISKNGKLVKRIIENVLQSDGCCGVECSKCSWAVHREEMDDDSPFLQCANEAIRQQMGILFLTSKRV
ncbi:hypothetical protein [Algicola sagamiensis]|uniref:hypothetical protein n=1 Tax=Algicola sagamiensis TaxID=163869 RepID=UPI0009FCB7C8|nr:hypothetical protein [Algicola sagamiensis]